MCACHCIENVFHCIKCVPSYIPKSGNEDTNATNLCFFITGQISGNENQWQINCLLCACEGLTHGYTAHIINPPSLHCFVWLHLYCTVFSVGSHKCDDTVLPSRDAGFVYVSDLKHMAECLFSGRITIYTVLQYHTTVYHMCISHTDNLNCYNRLVASTLTHFTRRCSECFSIGGLL